jgi:hypothetical protein
MKKKAKNSPQTPIPPPILPQIPAKEEDYPHLSPKQRALPVVIIPLAPGCPKCKWPNFRVRSTQGINQYVTCKSCNENYIRRKSRPIL